MDFFLLHLIYIYIYIYIGWESNCLLRIFPLFLEIIYLLKLYNIKKGIIYYYNSFSMDGDASEISKSPPFFFNGIVCFFYTIWSL